MMANLVWHYTAERVALEGILRDGCIHPAYVGIGGHEKPVAWFSSHPKYEPTAIKHISDAAGVTRAMTLVEQMERLGCARIAIDRSDALPWARLAKVAKISPTQQRRMLRMAREIGGSPTDWFGVIGPVPRALWLAVEVMRGGRWVELEQTQGAA